MDAEINNVIYMELYLGPKMAHGKYEKTNVARSIDRDSTVVRKITTCLNKLMITLPALVQTQYMTMKAKTNYAIDEYANSGIYEVRCATYKCSDVRPRSKSTDRNSSSHL
jgi:uncharacterized membrane protein